MPQNLATIYRDSHPIGCGPAIRLRSFDHLSIDKSHSRNMVVFHPLRNEEKGWVMKATTAMMISSRV